MLQRLYKMREEKGFTLIELLIVIIILGILAAIVVFAVGNITDHGQTSACSTDQKTIETAEEAYFAQNGHYTDMDGLTPKYLHDDSTLHSITLTGGDATDATGYSVAVVAGKGC